MKIDNNRKQAAQKRSIKYPDHLKQVENSKQRKEFTNLIPGTYMTYRLVWATLKTDASSAILDL